MVAASPLTRSSHHAGDDFARLKAARAAVKSSMPQFQRSAASVTLLPICSIWWRTSKSTRNSSRYAARLQSRPVRRKLDVTVLVADMTVAYKVIRETFTSRVTLDRQSLTILVEYLDGPFKRMQNRWTFYSVETKVCDVEFFIDYEFRSRALAMLMGAMFDAAFRRFAVAFEQSADEIYGR